jgi:hypothetical protein
MWSHEMRLDSASTALLSIRDAPANAKRFRLEVK